MFLILFYKFFFIIEIFGFVTSSEQFFIPKFDNNSNSKHLDSIETILQPILSKPFDQIVTLGRSCLTKMRVLSFLKYSNLSCDLSCNHLFDWMVPYNYSLFGNAIINNITDAFLNSTLIVKEAKTKNIILLYNPKYQFMFPHAFKNVKGVHDQIFTNELFKKFYNLIHEKFLYLSGKSRDAFSSEKRILYLIHIQGRAGETQNDLIRLMRAIKSKRNSNFFILVLIQGQVSKSQFLNYDFDKIIENNLYFHKIYEVNDPLGQLERKCEKSIKHWNELLEKFSFNNQHN